MKATRIIILHGWGLRGTAYNELISLLKQQGCQAYAPDLPGFGSQPLWSKSMNLDNYVDFLKDFIEKNHILNPILIGHSFGGRVAIKYAFQYPQAVSKLILTGVPVIRENSFSKKIAYIAAIVGGKVFQIAPFRIRETVRKFLYFLIGEWDYYKAGSLKQVFKNIIEEDLVQYIKEIKIPIILVWGKNDTITPVRFIYQIEKITPLAKSIIMKNSGHKLPYENPLTFFKAIKPFL